ncbi:diguanylate cyclase/two-component system sensory protein [Heliophilum fasciatum]|uniref:histidine kinase n=1 Tax=Heliophilum fasciatum TaxID=35700 RepID=A0A4R2RHC3_9FIRM|nr:signal transduction histidine kinase [Heliophilum fasciatum]TCP58585.1 diguanylate cyclase/two-component system sensory protein [Heliophilum fasciatum]
MSGLYLNLSKNKSDLDKKSYCKSSLLGISYALEDIVIQFELKAEMYVFFQEFRFFLHEIERYKQLDQICAKIFIFAQNIDFSVVTDFQNTVFIELEPNSPLRDEWNVIIIHPDQSMVISTTEEYDHNHFCEDMLRQFQGFLSLSPQLALQAARFMMNVLLKEYGKNYDSIYDENSILQSYDTDLCEKIKFFINRAMEQIEKKNEIIIQKKELIASIHRDLEKAQEETQVASIAKKQFLSNMSHELRTPMNSIVALTESLMDSSLTEEQKEYTELLQRSSNSLLTLIQDVLDYSKLVTGNVLHNYTEVYLEDFLSQIVQCLFPKAVEKGIRLDLSLDIDAHPVLVTDKVRLRKIILILAENAIKFTSDGYVVSVKTAPPCLSKWGCCMLILFFDRYLVDPPTKEVADPILEGSKYRRSEAFQKDTSDNETGSNHSLSPFLRCCK